MNDAEFERWQEAARRGQLTGDEIAALARQHGWTPEQCAELLLEVQLSRALAELPAPMVSSNFTHRVLEAVEAKPASSHFMWREWLARYWPRLAVPATATALAIYLGMAHHQNTVRRAQVAASVHAVATLVSAPASAAERLDLDVWDNFDVILRMGTVAADTELLRLLDQSQSR
ncbi:MAG: hypothetical protein N3J91_04810 [Verrucomicrobiae bacterium]|nr:hypothetical protein [Verrucomicrobiae bacterium]